jgi:hypothetical protein
LTSRKGGHRRSFADWLTPSRTSCSRSSPHLPGDQIITEHPKGHIIAEDTGLGFQRTDGIVILQIFQQGRSTEQKQAAYAELTKRLEAECGVRPEDVIVSVMANRHVDWSFGLGRAQFVDGTLKSLDRARQ